KFVMAVQQLRENGQGEAELQADRINQVGEDQRHLLTSGGVAGWRHRWSAAWDIARAMAALTRIPIRWRPWERSPAAAGSSWGWQVRRVIEWVLEPTSSSAQSELLASEPGARDNAVISRMDRRPILNPSWKGRISWTGVRRWRLWVSQSQHPRCSSTQ